MTLEDGLDWLTKLVSVVTLNNLVEADRYLTSKYGGK